MTLISSSIPSAANNDLVLLQAEKERRKRKREASSGPVWQPQYRKDGSPTPQVLAYQSEADVIGYGGAAGGGKTDLLLGFAGTMHTRSIIFRREFPRLEGVIARSREIFAPREDHRADSFNESLHRWSLEGGKRTIQLASMQLERDKYNFQGRPYDLYGFDEVTEFSESMVRFVTAWNRTTKSGQKCRVIMTFNPPMDEAGDWVTRYFAPWLDPQHANPAQDGELRWFAMVDGKETEVASGAPFEHEGETVEPKSRTFFHAYLKDNPILEAAGYASTINALPEPLRSLLKGSFDSGKIADPFQVIPAEWVRLAQKRWADGKPQVEGEDGELVPIKQTALGGDVARGGKDKTVIAPLYGTWFDSLLKYPGRSTPSGQITAGLILAAQQDGARIGMDVIGVGSSVFDNLRDTSADVRGINFGGGTKYTDKSGKMQFRNIRAAAYWCLREALDPENDTDVALPPDPELLADLCAPKWKLTAGKVIIEEKAEIVKRIGRSPDCGDAIVYAWWVVNGPPSGVDLVSW